MSASRNNRQAPDVVMQYIMTETNSDTQNKAGQMKVDLLLDSLCLSGKCITYAEMAEAASIPSPHKIHKLTEFLEDLMHRDIASGNPMRAAMVISKVRGMPAPGFFSLAKALGQYDGADTGQEAALFHQTCLKDLVGR